nr:MAG TPA: hypothetical protein [Caudoviricetes sp.]
MENFKILRRFRDDFRRIFSDFAKMGLGTS